MSTLHINCLLEHINTEITFVRGSDKDQNELKQRNDIFFNSFYQDYSNYKISTVAVSRMLRQSIIDLNDWDIETIELYAYGEEFNINDEIDKKRNIYPTYVSLVEQRLGEHVKDKKKSALATQQAKRREEKGQQIEEPKKNQEPKYKIKPQIHQ